MGEPDVKAIEEAVNRAKADRTRQAGEPTAADIMANDDTLRPFSIRLTAREIMALKGQARLKGVSTSDLVRSLLTQGLAANMNEPARSIDPRVAAVAMEKVREIMAWAVTAPPQEASNANSPSPLVRFPQQG
jgi:hypothetical protein